MMNPAALRKRFSDLTAEAASIRAQSAPFRDEYNAEVMRHTNTVAPLEKAIREAEAGLFEIEQERAMISRALNGKTG